MFELKYEPPIEPYVSKWEAQDLPFLTSKKIEEVCRDIAQKGANSKYHSYYDLLKEVIEEDIFAQTYEEYHGYEA